MNPTQREKIIMTFMPAAVVALLYGLLLNFSGHQQQYRDAQRQLAEFEPTAKTEDDVLIAGNRLELANERRDDVEQQLASRRGELQSLCRRFGDSNNQFRVLEAVSRLVEEHQVLLLSQGPVEPPELSSTKQHVLEKVDQYNGDAGLQYRQFELRGRYGDVLTLLQQVGELDVSVLPVALRLDGTDQASRMHAWNLVVVM